MLGIKGRLLWVLCLSTLLLIGGCRGEEPEDAWTPPPLADELATDPDPSAVIKEMIDFLKDQPEITAEALVTYEAPQESGQTLEFEMLQRIALARPDRLHWTTLHDDGVVDNAWFSNGRFNMLKLPANIWGQVDGPSTTREMLAYLADDYELDIPFGDLFSSRNLEQLWLGSEVAELWWVGEAWVQGHWTHHIAASRPGVDFELWVRKGDRPFPAKISITYTDAETQPSYVARFRKWSTTLPASTEFAFTPPPGAQRIEIVRGGE